RYGAPLNSQFPRDPSNKRKGHEMRLGWKFFVGAYIAICCASAADQALVLDSPKTGTYTIPSNAQFTGITALRVEMRLVGDGTTPPSCSGFAGTLWQFGGTFAFECLNASQFAFYDNSITAGAVWNVPAQTDVLVRMQWD